MKMPFTVVRTGREPGRWEKGSEQMGSGTLGGAVMLLGMGYKTVLTREAGGEDEHEYTIEQD